MYLISVVSFCVIGTVLGQCADGQIEYECKPCNQKCSGEPVMCDKSCVPGCACPANTVLDAENKCVDPATCPIRCSKINEIFYAAPKCVALCHQTCESYLADGPVPQACTDQCISNQCGCPEGNLKDEYGNCVTPEQCKQSKSCAPGELFYDFKDNMCAPCKRSCLNYYKENVACTMECASGVCRCAPGYVINPDANVKGCVPADQCPINKDCGKNAMLPWDGACAPCERTCDNFYKPNIPCLAICIRGKCTCKDGFVRNAQRECVPTSECPVPTCGAGEKFYGGNECRPCEESCPNVPQTRCTRECVSNVCSCQAGFKRDSESKCVQTCPAAA